MKQVKDMTDAELLKLWNQGKDEQVSPGFATQLRQVRKEIIKRKLKLENLDEGKSDYLIYHRLYSDAVGEAIGLANRNGYDVDGDDLFHRVTTGPRKPSEGKTNSFKLALTKNGKETRRMLVFQIYGLQRGMYELTAYIS